MNLKVQMGAGGKAGVATPPDRLALRHLLALAHIHRLQMRVEGQRTVRMLDLDEEPIAAAGIAADEAYATGGDRHHRVATRRKLVDIDARMGRAKVRGDAAARNWPDKAAVARDV